jgi:hypothetical protein
VGSTAETFDSEFVVDFGLSNAEGRKPKPQQSLIWQSC